MHCFVRAKKNFGLFEGWTFVMLWPVSGLVWKSWGGVLTQGFALRELLEGLVGSFLE